MKARTRLGVALAAATALAGAAVAPVAGAAPPILKGLHDARYCEILELHGAPPAGTVTVWNTIGLNRCPPAQWSFDATALAKELGASVVVLNGPRHFLMDSVQAVPGPTRSFHGLKMRRVARIPIRTAADLVTTPYTDRTIKRDNVWRWDKGRTVYELVAPGGDTYVMQSYSQIKDPSLKLASLGRLGKRLKPPTGWRYRARVLRRPLALAANGSATITQDELGNTYQLATTTRRGPRAAHKVSIAGTTATVPAATAGTIEDHGKLTGTPFGNGTLVLVGTFSGPRLAGTVRMTFARGSILAAIDLPFTVTGNEIDFRGVAHVVSGTGAYRGITGGDLLTTDHNTLDGQHGTVAVTGTVTY